MDLAYSEDQRALLGQARKWLHKKLPTGGAADPVPPAAGQPATFWRSLGEMGWLGMLLPKDFGGMALSHTDSALLFEEMGRALLPEPVLPTILGARAILLGGGNAQRESLLPAVAAGKLRLAVALPPPATGDPARESAIYFDTRGDGYVLSGSHPGVPGLMEAELMVVGARPADGGDGLGLFLIDGRGQGVERRALTMLDPGSPQGRLRLTAVEVGVGERLEEIRSEDVTALVLRLADLALASDALGGAARVMEMAVEYAKTRTAFGQQIGGFQAIKHKCADMLHAVESLRALVMWCGWVMDVPQAESGVTRKLATAMARATAMETYEQVVRHATQIHGAIALTEEHGLHRFAKRAKTLGLAYGTLAQYQETILRENGFDEPEWSQPNMARGLNR